jgi:hypothetical protein
MCLPFIALVSFNVCFGVREALQINSVDQAAEIQEYALPASLCIPHGTTLFSFPLDLASLTEFSVAFWVKLNPDQDNHV